MRVHPALGVATVLLSSLLPTRSGTYASWSEFWFTGPEMAAGLASPLRDPDGDGCRNLAEYFAATSPRDGSDCLQVQPDVAPGESAEIHYSHEPTSIDTTCRFLVSNDLLTWHDHGTLTSSGTGDSYQLNGYQFGRLLVQPGPGVSIDSDGDGLDDFFEERLLASDPSDGFSTLADILPGDDFDSNGTPNSLEPENRAPVSGQSKPALLAAAAVGEAVDALVAPGPASLQVHTPLD